MQHFKRIVLLVVVLIGTLTSVALPQAKQAPVPPVQEQTKEVTVYVTRTGAKYHAGSCRYLSRSKIPISLKEAKKSYTPCSVCRPPQ
jgi:competence protein ComEC